MTNKDREKKIKLLKALTTEQLINELRRRRGVSPDFKLMWVHPEAFYKGLGEQAEAVNKEIEKEKAEKELTEKLKEPKK